MSFKSTHNHGFQMTFENGFTISVQWGTGNYCERRFLTANPNTEMQHPIVESSSAEIAIWHKDFDTWFDFGNDQVKGWCEPNEVGIWISKIIQCKDLSDLYKMV